VKRAPRHAAEPMFFDSREDFRRWLEANHEKAPELWVGYYKKASGRRGMTYAEAVDEALCFGWIDGVARSVDETSYANRYTPRRKDSNWSAINVRRIGELQAAGRMHPAGMRAFEAREPAKTGVYVYENRPAELPSELEATFRRNPEAWAFFSSLTPSYRRTAIWWVVSAKRPETRERRLATLIDDSAQRRRSAQILPPGRAGEERSARASKSKGD
jgi:uncharacterized protein YdeI (YjbR/CyaY-like superfamily)